MKRIVECPSCKTKMQIFDIGKDINQKCPRCQNFFDIHPEDKKEPEAKAEAAKAESPETKPSELKAENPETKPAEVKAETPETPSDAVKAENPEIKEEPKDAEKPAGKKIFVKPASSKTAKNSMTAEKTATDEAAAKPDVPTPPEAAEKPADTSKKPLTAPKPTAAPAPAAAAAPVPELPPAGFSGMQFMILAALLVIAIIIQVVFAKKQMAQMSIVNDNYKAIYNKLQ